MNVHRNIKRGLFLFLLFSLFMPVDFFALQVYFRQILMSLSIFQMPQSCFQVAYKVSFLVSLMYLLQLLQLIFTTSKYQVLVLLEKKLVGRDEGIVKEFLIN